MIKVTIFSQKSERHEMPWTEKACKGRYGKEWQQLRLLKQIAHLC